MVPALLPANADGSLSSRLESWRRGFLGWWEDHEEFLKFCTLGKPEPKGSIALEHITDLLFRRSKNENGEVDAADQKVEVQHEMARYDAAMTFDFGGPAEAEKWFDALRQVLSLLGLREIQPAPAPEPPAAEPEQPLSADSEKKKQEETKADRILRSRGKEMQPAGG